MVDKTKMVKGLVDVLFYQDRYKSFMDTILQKKIKKGYKVHLMDGLALVNPKLTCFNVNFKAMLSTSLFTFILLI